MGNMRALVKAQDDEGLWLEEVPIPEPGPGEVRIRVEKAAICGTDLHIFNWDEWAREHVDVGRILGHEFVGRIDAIGVGAERFAVGQRVSAEGHVVCGVCRNCKRGKAHLCSNQKGIGVSRDGAFADYVIVPATNLWPIPDQVPSELAAFFDPFGNATHSALNFDLVGEDVLITGAGPIGIIAAGICRHVGARHVVITDINDYRLGLAADMGASRIVNVRNESLEEVVGELDMEGFDVGLEMSGQPAAFQSMLDTMYPGGKIALLGILPKGSGIDWDDVIFKGLEIKGIYGRRMFETWYKMTQLVLSGFPLEKVLTHQLPANEFAEGFALMRDGQCGKIVLDWQ